MNIQQLLMKIRELFLETWALVFPFLRRHTWPLLAAVLIALVVLTGWNWYRDMMKYEFVILTGPGGSSSHDAARAIADQIEKQSTTYWKSYSVRFETTAGFEENRRRIAADHSGSVIGFAHDGFGDSKNIRVLLPLERNHLHILVRRKWLENLEREQELVAIENQANDSAEFSLVSTNSGQRVRGQNGSGNSIHEPTFSQISDDLVKGRLAPGPPGSGTRQLAKLVLEQFGMDVDQYQSHGIVSWHDMRAALRNNSIDMAFYCGPIGAPIIKSIAEDKTAVLVDLGEARDAIENAHHHILAGTLAKNSYLSGFCRSKINTIVSRKVLICPATMANGAASLVSKQTFAALRDKIPQLAWSTSKESRPNDIELTYQSHTAALESPAASPATWLPIPPSMLIWTLGSWFLIELLVWITAELKKLRRRNISEEEGETYESLKVKTDNIVQQIDQLPIDIDENTKLDWKNRIKELRRRIAENLANGIVNPARAKSLMMGIREAQYELDWRETQIAESFDVPAKKNRPKKKKRAA